MLKVIKYDWKNGWYNIRTLLAAALVLSVLAGLTLRIFESVLLSVVWTAVMWALLVLTVAAIFRNMSGRMFGAEGYLTHTLPVSTWELLLGKSVGTWLFGVFMVFAAIILWVILIIIDAGMPEVWCFLMEVVDALPKLGAYHFRSLAIGMGHVLAGIASFLVASFMLVVQLQFICIAARQFGKYHIAGGIIVFIVLSSLESNWNQSLAIGFLSVVLFSALCFAGSCWLLKKRMSI